MTTKEWLNRGYKLDKEINALLKEQSAALTRATGSTCGTNAEKVQTSRRNTTEDRYINYASYSELIDNRIDELYAIKQEILSAINKVDDAVLRTLLIEKYVNFHTWEQIACDMNYSYVHVVHNLHPKALNAISKIVNSI
ncbi:MAG: DUF1492 domain-containing protein [Hominilimicola sp.]